MKPASQPSSATGSVALTHDLDTDKGLLGLLTRKIFHSGFDRDVVDRKWNDFERVFAGFDPVQVAAMTVSDVASDPGIVRNRAKIQGVIANAQHFVMVAQTHGTWRSWFHSLRGLTYEERSQTLRACLRHVGDTTLFYFLLEAGEAEPGDRPEHVRPPPDRRDD